MDTLIGAVNSTVRAVDGESLLTPQVLDRIVQAVLAELEARQRSNRNTGADRRMRTGLSEPPWLDERGGNS